MGENRIVALKPRSIRDANGCDSFSFSGRIVPRSWRSCTGRLP